MQIISIQLYYIFDYESNVYTISIIEEKFKTTNQVPTDDCLGIPEIGDPACFVYYNSSRIRGQNKL